MTGAPTAHPYWWRSACREHDWQQTWPGASSPWRRTLAVRGGGSWVLTILEGQTRVTHEQSHLLKCSHSLPSLSAPGRAGPAATHQTVTGTQSKADGAAGPQLPAGRSPREPQRISKTADHHQDPNPEPLPAPISPTDKTRNP